MYNQWLSQMEQIPMAKMTTVLTVLNSGVVVDQSKLAGLGPEEMSTVMDTAYSFGKNVKFVPNAALFFTPKNLMAMLKEDNQDWVLVADRFNVEISTSELDSIRLAQSIVTRIRKAAEGIKPAYPFANVPAGWTVGANIKVVGSSVKRVGHDNSYSIGLMTLQRLWKRVSPYWAGHVAHIEGVPVTAGGYGRTAVTNKNGVDVGCQNIRRYELEQFAVSQGWDFPQG